MMTAARRAHVFLFLATTTISFSLSPGTVSGQATPPGPLPCAATFTSPLFVPGTGTFGGIVIDAACQHVYLTNTAQNRVEIFSLQTLTFQAPIQVGAQPVGLDITLDGSLLYVANSGSSSISVIDLARRAELRRIVVPSTFSNDTPYSIAIANNGVALFSTTFSGSGFGARMMQLQLATDQVTQRADFWFSGTTTERTQLAASGDRGTIGIVAGDISSGPVFTYAAATNTFSPEKDLAAFISGVSLNVSGSTILVTPGAYVLDGNLNLAGTIRVDAGWGGGAVDAMGATGYRAVASRVDVLNLTTFLKTGELALGDSVDSAYFTNFVGQMDISADGSLLAVLTDHGFAMVRTATAAPVDRTPPTLTLPADITVPATSSAGAVVSFVVTATDDSDPSPIVSCTPPSGTTFAIGTTGVTCAATDASNNAVTGTFKVRVTAGAVQLLEGLVQQVRAEHIGPGRSLAQKLQRAVDAATSGAPAGQVCGVLGAVLHEVHAQSGKHITREQAKHLIAQIGAVRTLLGCNGRP